jgi:MFS family permease
MILRFCLYSVLKNLRFAAPFLAIYLLQVGFTYAEIGSMLGCQHLITAVLEIPSGVGADRWGRRRVLIGSFAFHALGLAILALGAQSGPAPSAIWFFLGLGIFGVGEALRTGSHKAIMLDYLETSGQAERATAVLSVTRMCSKVSSALAGLGAGVWLYFMSDYASLFWLSATAAGAGLLLILSYPAYLEGEFYRQRAEPRDALLESERNLMSLLRNARLWPLLLRSVVFESQTEIIIKLFLQPFLYVGLSTAGIPLVPVDAGSGVRAAGSLVVGVNELFRDGLGAVGARSSARVERASASRSRALTTIYVSSAAVILLVGLCALDVRTWFLPGLAAVGLVTLLQNVRRPMYVSELNDAANKPLRATTLSIDNQATSLLTAILMPLLGLAADRWGLWIIGVLAALVLVLGLAFRPGDIALRKSLSTDSLTAEPSRHPPDFEPSDPIH